MATSPDPPAKAPPTIVLAKRGDVLLKLGDPKQPAASILVSSGVLSVASSVFDAMFSGHFAEGQNLSSTNPREIPLPDDDPTCMTILSMIIHMQSSDIPRQLDVVTLADFAILCEKYDCINAVRSWGRVWVLELLPTPTVPNYDKLLMISYALDLPDEFYKVTQSLIRHRTFCVELDVAAHGREFIPLKVFSRLQKGQLHYQHQVVQTLKHHEMVFSYSHGVCPEPNKILIDFIDCLESEALWPGKAMKLSEYRDRLAGMRQAARSSCKCRDTSSCHKGPALRTTILQNMDRVINSIQGMCLDCVYREHTGKKELTCRIKHAKEPY